MSLMAIMLTRQDLDALPEDGLRHELIDGAVVMTPAPGLPHQSFVLALASNLREAAMDTALRVVIAPFDVVLGASVVEPDILVARRAGFTDWELSSAPTLVVEVHSSSTGWLDEGRKRTLYQEHGVAHYWLVDPQKPSITFLELVDGHYIETGTAKGDQTVSIAEPFPMVLNPAALAGG